jgi:hypothetical protein
MVVRSMMLAFAVMTITNVAVAEDDVPQQAAMDVAVPADVETKPLRSDPGASQIIDAFGACRMVQNTSKVSIMLPFRSAGEWRSFINAKPAGFTMTTCCSPTSVDICGFTQSLGYGMLNDKFQLGVEERSVVFSCTDDGWSASSATGDCP